MHHVIRIRLTSFPASSSSSSSSPFLFLESSSLSVSVSDPSERCNLASSSQRLTHRNTEHTQTPSGSHATAHPTRRITCIHIRSSFLSTHLRLCIPLYPHQPASACISQHPSFRVSDAARRTPHGEIFQSSHSQPSAQSILYTPRSYTLCIYSVYPPHSPLRTSYTSPRH